MTINTNIYLKNKLLNMDPSKLYYTASVPNFTHPSRLKQKYTLETFNASILEKSKEDT
jgi:hypothetical protein